MAHQKSNGRPKKTPALDGDLTEALHGLLSSNPTTALLDADISLNQEMNKFANGGVISSNDSTKLTIVSNGTVRYNTWQSYQQGWINSTPTTPPYTSPFIDKAPQAKPDHNLIEGERYSYLGSYFSDNTWDKLSNLEIGAIYEVISISPSGTVVEKIGDGNNRYVIDPLKEHFAKIDIPLFDFIQNSAESKEYIKKMLQHIMADKKLFEIVATSIAIKEERNLIEDAIINKNNTDGS